MRKIFFFLLILFTCHFCLGQYTVTKVIGLVKNKASGEILKAGSKLSDDDVLIFSSLNDMVRVIVAGKGIYIISPSTKAEAQQNELVEILRSALHVKFREGYLSGRAGKAELIPGIFETQESLNKKNLFGAENKYLFDPNVFDVSRGRFFLQIESQGAGTFIHRLPTASDTLIIRESDLQADARLDPEKTTYKLGFFSNDKNSSEALALIRPYVDSTGEMETIVKLIIESGHEQDIAKLEDMCYAEVYAALGKPSTIAFKDLFNKLVAKALKK